jgi:hypothetical protein
MPPACTSSNCTPVRFHVLLSPLSPPCRGTEEHPCCSAHTQSHLHSLNAEDAEEQDCEESDADAEDSAALDDEDPQHEQLLARIAAEGSKRKKRTVVLNEGIMEGEHSVAAAGHDMHADGPAGELGLDEVLHATQVSKADRKALQKLATGNKVC